MQCYSVTKSILADLGQSPFPFTKLPAEIRNKIYSHAATTYHFGRLNKYNSSWYGHPYRLRYDGNYDIIVQPGIVCCSKQTRAEGLVIFFQAHHFQFDLSRGRHFGEWSTLVFLTWLEKLRTVERENIRNITFKSYLSNSDVLAMDRIHAMLSEKATVIYLLTNLKHSSSVLEIVRMFRSRCARKATIQDVYHDHGVVPWWAGSLRFLPGMSWFGEQNEVGDQVKTEED